MFSTNNTATPKIKYVAATHIPCETNSATQPEIKFVPPPREWGQAATEVLEEYADLWERLADA